MNNKVSSLEATLHSTEGKLREAEYELKVARQDADARGSAASKAGNELEGLRRELATERATSGEKIDLLSKSKEELTRQAQELEDALREKEAAYNAIKRSAGADVQAMQAEAAALSREVTRWREHHAQLKTQLEKRERELQLMKESSRATATDADSKLRQLSQSAESAAQKQQAAEAEVATLQRRLDEVSRASESRLQMLQTELSRARESIREAHEGGNSFKLEVTSLEQELKLVKEEHGQAKEELHALRAEHDAAVQRVRSLRQELAQANNAHMRELEEKSKVVNDVLSAMQAEERSKISASEEARAARARVTELETKLALLKGNLHDSIDAKRRTEDAFSAAQSALHSMKQKAGVYRQENKMLLSNYDQWLKTMVDHKSPSDSPQRVSSSRREHDAPSNMNISSDTPYQGAYKESPDIEAITRKYRSMYSQERGSSTFL